MTTVVVNGFFVGLVYALLGVGIVVIYRGARVINFAYSETGMIAAFVFADLWLSDGRPMVLALIAGLTLATAIGALTEVLVARPLRNEPPVIAMVGTFGVASLLLVYAGRRWGLNPRFMEPLIGGTGVRFGGVTIQPGQLLILGVSAALLSALALVYRYSSFGLRLRATALDPDAAAQVGVNVDRTAMATWALGGLLAGISAILVAPLVGFSVFFMTGLLARGIAAALVGGLTSVWGAACSGVLIGIAEGVIGYATPVSGVTEAAVAVFIIVLLLVRPSGLVRGAY
jgi:branched-chain amino acid transport system permease protein